LGDIGEINKTIPESEINQFPKIGGRLKQKPKIIERTYYVDDIKKEQANEQHRRLVSKFSAFLKSKSIKPLRRGRVDLLGVKDDKALLFEMKSTTNKNMRKQVRNAIGQLFDYEFLELEKYRVDKEIIKIIVLEKKPPTIIIKWLDYSKILLYWIEDDKIASTNKNIKFLESL